jgi:hypothetical protein
MLKNIEKIYKELIKQEIGYLFEKNECLESITEKILIIAEDYKDIIPKANTIVTLIEAIKKICGEKNIH